MGNNFSDLSPENEQTILGSDGTKIGNVGDRLKVTGDGSVTKFSNTYRSYIENTDITLNSVSGSYTTLYTRSGTGKFIGCSLRFSDKKVLVRIAIDGVNLFSLNMEAFDDFDIAPDKKILCEHFWNKDKDVYTFCPLHPIEYGSNVTIFAKASDDKSGRKSTVRLINLTEDS